MLLTLNEKHEPESRKRENGGGCSLAKMYCNLVEKYFGLFKIKCSQFTLQDVTNILPYLPTS